MKIIHCADLHLDSQMTANLTKEQARERKREIIRTFTRMVEYAEKTGVRLIMISGDLFDTRNVSALARNTVRDMICTHPQIDFLYLRGNHDSDNFLSDIRNQSGAGQSAFVFRYMDCLPVWKYSDQRNRALGEQPGDRLQFPCAGA